MGFKFMRADENVLYGGSVAGGAASGFNDDWLVDGKVNQPAKASTGTQTWTATGTTGTISLIVVANHNIDAGRTITIGGDVSTTMVGPAARTNGINVNPWKEITPVSGNDVSVAVASNANPLVIGELLAGRLRETTHGLRVRTPFVIESRSIRHETEGGTVIHYERPFIRRGIRTSMGATQSELDLLIDWYESTRANTRPSVILPFDEHQDAWVVEFVRLDYAPYRYTASSGTYDVSMEFAEFPRYRW